MMSLSSSLSSKFPSLTGTQFSSRSTVAFSIPMGSLPEKHQRIRSALWVDAFLFDFRTLHDKNLHHKDLPLDGHQ